ncbi:MULTISPECIES: hypothetical protein [Citrobacter]|uniref:hypothetical protein n=1 Tax=Citrobacter TaxID=544 RepID=UPI0006A9FD53|nr:hypothetical protein [Citrobacter braakii]TCC68055.1 hypothetical protein EY919_23175 [Citrobacter braakii]WFY33719.1 hypothetical protein NFK28_14915 [Citrobacter braakii]
MEGKLIFCSDSILRFRSDYDETTALPLLSIQKTISDTDPFFLLRFFRHTVIIEEGTTLANIFFAIEPWKELLTAYLDRDVGAYIDEVRKPSKPTTWDLEWIGIDRRSSVYRAYQHQDMRDSEDFTAWINRERIPTDEFDIESSCDASGFIKGDKERWSLSENVHEIKNLPVILYNKQTLMTLQKDVLLRESVSGVSSTDRSHFVYGDTSFSFYEVMEAIFISGLFFHSPHAAASNFEELKDSLTGLENEVLEKAEPNLADSGEDKPLKVEVVEGAFDSLITHMESETENWQLIKKQCQKEGSLPVRIGVITPAEPPELRMCGELLKLERS